MRAKLYITGIPFYLTESKLRSLLAPCPLHSLTFIHTVHGNVGIAELNALQDAQTLSVILSRYTLEDGCKLSAVPAESSKGYMVEQLVNRIAKKQTVETKGHAPA
jgi:hypothetical protein